MENFGDSTIRKCFRRTGILREDFTNVQPALSYESDPFADIEADIDSAPLFEVEAADKEVAEFLTIFKELTMLALSLTL